MHVELCVGMAAKFGTNYKSPLHYSLRHETATLKVETKVKLLFVTRFLLFLSGRCCTVPNSAPKWNKQLGCSTRFLATSTKHSRQKIREEEIYL